MSLETLAQDFRYSLRQLLRNPGFTLLAILTLGLGIGANSAIFSVVDSVLLRRLPFRDADRLVMVWLSHRADGTIDVTSYPNYMDWKRQNAFSGISAFTTQGVNVTGDGEDPERIPAALVSSDFFSVLGEEPELGRTFEAREEQPGEDAVVLLSHGFWQRRFGADPRVLGRTLRARGRTSTIVGVLPAGFDFPKKAQLWFPLALNPRQREERYLLFLRTVARLRPGQNLAAAGAVMETVGERLRRQYPDVLQDYGVTVRPLRDYLVGDIRPALLILFGAVTLVLFIACANVANLLLARAVGREREIVVRTAVGASRGRVVRQLLTESVTLGLLGGGAGFLLAIWGVGLLRSVSPASLRETAEISVHARVLFFTLAVSVGTGILFGLAPAFQASRPQLGEALKERGPATGGRRRRRLLQGLVVAEIALALSTPDRGGAAPTKFLGFAPPGAGGGYGPSARLQHPAHPLGLPEAGAHRCPFPGAPGARAHPAGRAVSGGDLGHSAGRYRQRGGDRSRGASRSSAGPTGERDDRRCHPRPLSHPGRADRARAIVYRTGRGRRGTVAVINQVMARRFWPGEEAVGKRFKLGAASSDAAWVTVVGVVSDAWRSSPERGEAPSCYLPLQHLSRINMTLVVRTAGNPRPLAPAIARAVHAMNPNLPVARVATVDELMGEHLSVRRFNALLIGAFALLALSLATVGIYGVVSCMVSEARHEIGIRMALGAQSGDELRRVLLQGMVLVLLGIALGLGGALLAGRALASAVAGVRAVDPFVFCGLSLFLMLVASAASWLPARRAAHSDPLTVLRAG